MANPGLNLHQTVNLSQQLRMILNPRMLQLLKTLHLPYLDLMESINRESTENPALEVEKQDELLEYARNLRLSRSTSAPVDFDDSMPDREIKDLGPSLQNYLIEQIKLEDLEEADQDIAEYIINNIDERGYIKDYPKVREEIMKEFQVKSCNVDKILSLVQTLEPEGVGARNLKECLLIQVQEYNFESEQLQDVIYNTIKYHFEDLAKKKFDEIAKALDIEPDGVQHIADFVEKNLTPAPGLQYHSDRKEQTIIPSFQIKKEESSAGPKYLAVNLEKEKGPQLRISSQYMQILDNPETDEKTKKFIKEKLEAARIFIDNINKRHDTIQRIIDIITSSQQDFFNKGYYWLNPLQQNKLANLIGVHPSTISRAVSTKYAETPQGLYPLKYMCPRNFKGLSAMQIKGMMKNILGANKKLSDQKISDFLRETRNVDIKRRTVTKYRMELGESSSYERINE